MASTLCYELCRTKKATWIINAIFIKKIIIATTTGAANVQIWSRRLITSNCENDKSLLVVLWARYKWPGRRETVGGRGASIRWNIQTRSRNFIINLVSSTGRKHWWLPWWELSVIRFYPFLRLRREHRRCCVHNKSVFNIMEKCAAINFKCERANLKRKASSGKSFLMNYYCAAVTIAALPPGLPFRWRRGKPSLWSASIHRRSPRAAMSLCRRSSFSSCRL